MLAKNDSNVQLDSSNWFNFVQNEREKAISHERSRFSNELHDTVASGLQTAILHLQEARQRLAADQTGALNSLEAAEQDIRSCWADARRCAVALRPADLDRLGLPGALADFARRMGAASGVGVRFNICGTTRDFPAAAELALFRAGQEAVANAIRHAGANAISVELCYERDAVRLDIIDNGRGFDVHKLTLGSGLLSLHDRASENGAELSITSRPEEGTQVTIALPFVDGAELGQNRAHEAIPLA